MSFWIAADDKTNSVYSVAELRALLFGSIRNVVSALEQEIVLACDFRDEPISVFASRICQELEACRSRLKRARMRLAADPHLQQLAADWR